MRPWIGAILFFAALGSLQARTFVHPGVLHTIGEFEFIREKVLNKEDPWIHGWNKMLADDHDAQGKIADVGYSPKKHVGTLYLKKCASGHDFARDIAAAYSHAIQWLVTRNPAHAKKAVEIINGYKTVTGIATCPGEWTHNRGILMAWRIPWFVEAAEIIRHTYPGWEQADIRAFENFLRKKALSAVVPWCTCPCGTKGQCHDCTGRERKGEHVAHNLNHSASIIATGIFCDDQALFDRGIAMWKYVLEKGTCADGDLIEVCRGNPDYGHAGHGMLNWPIVGAEIAYNQGVDLYGYLDNRLMKVVQQTSAALLGQPVKYYCGTFRKDFSSWFVSENLCGFIIPYNHYVHVRGFPSSSLSWAKKMHDDHVYPHGQRNWQSGAMWPSLLFDRVPHVPGGNATPVRGSARSRMESGRSTTAAGGAPALDTGEHGGPWYSMSGRRIAPVFPAARGRDTQYSPATGGILIHVSSSGRREPKVAVP